MLLSDVPETHGRSAAGVSHTSTGHASPTATIAAPPASSWRSDAIHPRAAGASHSHAATIPGTTVYPSEANFVLFVPAGDATALWQALADRGVLVRDMTAVVPGALRVTAGSEHETDLFLGALKEALHA